LIPKNWKLGLAAMAAAALLELPFSQLPGRCRHGAPCLPGFGLAPLLWRCLPGRATHARCVAAFCSATSAAFSGTWATATGAANTMAMYGGLPAFVPVLLLTGFSLVLGLYFGLFGLGIALVRRPPAATKGALRPLRCCGPRLSLRLPASHRSRGINLATLRWTT